MQTPSINDDNELVPKTLTPNQPDFFNDELSDKQQNLAWKQRLFGPLNSGSVRSSIVSIASICFGSASLSLPIAITNVGLILGIIMFFSLSAVCYWTMRNLLYAARKQKMFDFSKLIELTLGKKMLFITDLNNIIYMIGVLMALEFTISEFFMNLSTEYFQINPEESNLKIYQKAFCCFFLQIPMGLMKNVSKLQYASLIGTFTLIYTIFVIVIQSPFYYQEAIEDGRHIEFTKNIDWSILKSFSIFLYAFSCQNGILAIYSELKKPTLRRCNKVLDRAVILQLILFTPLGFAGFFSLLKETPSIFISRVALKSFNGKDFYMTISLILFCFSLNCICALNYNVLRNAIRSFFFNNKEIRFITDFFITVSIFICTNLITYYVNNVIQIVGIVGGFCAVIVCYVSPILCYVKSNQLPLSHISNLANILILIIICGVGIMSTYSTIYDIVFMQKEK